MPEHGRYSGARIFSWIWLLITLVELCMLASCADRRIEVKARGEVGVGVSVGNR